MGRAARSPTGGCRERWLPIRQQAIHVRASQPLCARALSVACRKAAEVGTHCLPTARFCLAPCPRSLNSNARLNTSASVPHALLSVELGSWQWQNQSVDWPADLGQTHAGAALVGGRHLFIVAGQVSLETAICNAVAIHAGVVEASLPAVYLPLLLRRCACCRRAARAPPQPSRRIGWTCRPLKCRRYLSCQSQGGWALSAGLSTAPCRLSLRQPAQLPGLPAHLAFLGHAQHACYHLSILACHPCRYSPTLAMLGDGRLHAFGGLLPDRATPAREHWSLDVHAGDMAATCSVC